MIRILTLAVLLPLAAHAQLVLSVVDGTAETTLVPNSVYQMRSMEVGDSQSVHLKVRNSGQQPAQITSFFADGTGFSLNRPLPPQTLAAGAFLNATLTFDATAAANYSANLQLNGTSVLMLVSVTPGPQLTVPASCAGTVANTVDFGIVTKGEPRSCDLTLSNPTSQPMTVSTLTATGTGFSLSRATSPFTLGPGQSTSFGVQVTSQAVGVATGTLKIQTRDYGLRATVVNAPMPAPIFEFDSSPPASAQQRRLTLRLPSPATSTTTGQLHLSFTADSILATDDPAVMFVETSSRQIPFTVEEGNTSVTLNGASFATFQTGTTAGRIRFTLSGIPPGPAADAETTVILAPTQIVLDKALPARFPNRLELVLTGFDNTLSAGSMSFRFFDAAGQPITAAMPADFTGAFRAFYASAPGGSTFKVTVLFPITGNSNGVAAVEAELSNSAGTIRTVRLNF